MKINYHYNNNKLLYRKLMNYPYRVEEILKIKFKKVKQNIGKK